MDIGSEFKPDIVRVGQTVWAEEYTGPIARSMDPPLPITTESSLRMAARWQEERCGLIDNYLAPHFVKNIASSPRDNFLMDMEDVAEVLKRVGEANRRIVGIFHTHPGGSPLPSGNDIAGWPNRDLKWRYFIATPDYVYEYAYRNQPDYRV